MEKIVFISGMISVIVTSVTGIIFIIGMKMMKSPNSLTRAFGKLIVTIILLIATVAVGFYICL